MQTGIEEGSTVMQIITKVSQFMHQLLTAELEYQKRKTKIRLIEGFSLEKIFAQMDTFKTQTLSFTYLREWMTGFGYTMEDQELEKLIERWFKLGTGVPQIRSQNGPPKKVSKIDKAIRLEQATDANKPLELSKITNTSRNSGSREGSTIQRTENLHEITRNHFASKNNHVKTMG